jgi:hypothetical protein
MTDEEMELAWFWFRGASAALGGILRGRKVRGKKKDDDDDLRYLMLL